jgi:rare lipoprotein A
MVHLSDALGCGELARYSLRVLASFQPTVATIAFALTLACASCDRAAVHAQTKKPKLSAEAQPSSSPKKDHRQKLPSQEGYAVWYSVPVDSLANRRAGKGEFTAAHNHLPLGSMVRVTHLANGKSVIVRITDRGITKRGASIDLCKPAAEKLEMISEGMARVRIEELPNDTGTDAPPDSQATSANPRSEYW